MPKKKLKCSAWKKGQTGQTRFFEKKCGAYSVTVEKGPLFSPIIMGVTKGNRVLKTKSAKSKKWATARREATKFFQTVI